MSTLFPVQPVDVRVIPEAVYRAAYEVYCYLYGPQPSMVDIEKGCRGGFTPGEIIALLYARAFPQNEWGTRFSEALWRSN